MKPAALMTAVLFLCCIGCHEPPTGNNVIRDGKRWLKTQKSIECSEPRIVGVGDEWHQWHYILQADCLYSEPGARQAYGMLAYLHLRYERAPLGGWKLMDLERIPSPDAVEFNWAKEPPSAVGEFERNVATLQWDLFVLLGFPAAVCCVALFWFFMARCSKEEAEVEEPRDGPPSLSPVGPTRIVLYRVALAAYATSWAFLLFEFIEDPWPRWLSYSALPLIVISCFQWGWARISLRLIAGFHALCTLVLFKNLVNAVDLGRGVGGVALFMAVNITLPTAILVLSYGSPRPVAPLNLPSGYAFSLTRRRALGPLQRLLLVMGVTLAAILSFVGGPLGLLLIAVFVMPVVIGSYLIFHFAATRRKTPAPQAQRRLRVSPKMQKPAQTRHYWTIDDSQYDDPDTYQQSSPRPKISREKER